MNWKIRRSFKALDQILGSGDKTIYLTMLPNGRILGAVWLEKEKERLKGRKLRYKCPVCDESYFFKSLDFSFTHRSHNEVTCY